MGLSVTLGTNISSLFFWDLFFDDMLDGNKIALSNLRILHLPFWSMHTHILVVALTHSTICTSYPRSVIYQINLL